MEMAVPEPVFAKIRFTYCCGELGAIQSGEFSSLEKTQDCNMEYLQDSLYCLSLVSSFSAEHCL